MDHDLRSNIQQPQMNPNEVEQPIINGYTGNYIYGAIGVYRSNQPMQIDKDDVILEGVRYYDIGARTICDDGFGNRWVVAMNTNPDQWGTAQGPFDQNQVVRNDNGVITGFILDGKVQSVGTGSSPCLGICGFFWIIHRRTELDYNVQMEQETGSGAAGESQSVGHVQNSLSFDEIYEMLGVDRDEVAQTGPHSIGCVADGADCGAPIAPTSHGAPGSYVEFLQDSTRVSSLEEGLESLSERARMGGEVPVVSTSHEEVAVPVIMATESTDNEGLVSPVLGNFVPTPQQRDSGECLTEQSSGEGQMAGQMAGGTVATTSTNPKAFQPSRKRPRQAKFKHHGASQRGGGRTSWAAYFRPTGLPDSDKSFLTIGEFTNGSDAWHAFNLFALVHEGVQACIDPIDLDSLSVEAEYWGQLPRVELLAHLRLKGREYFARDNVLPPDSKIPRYRNVKYTANARKEGKITWMCDVALPKGVVDPKYPSADGSTKTCNFDTPEEAAKEADRLMMLKEGIMGWTNYPLTDYMTEEEKEQWDPTWVPLQDNSQKYLQNLKV